MIQSRCSSLLFSAVAIPGTVRRFCEHFLDGVDRIAFAVSSPSDEFIYLELLPLYFPRSAEEEAMAEKLLPEDTGNEWGETVMEERKIRIAAVPGTDSLVTPVTSFTSTQHTVNLDCHLCDFTALDDLGLYFMCCRHAAPFVGPGGGATAEALTVSDFAQDTVFSSMRSGDSVVVASP
jgi:hypothetical protein